MTPVLSIIIPCYNHGKYIQETLDSIKRHHNVAPAYEVIIVNDGSTDTDTIRILEQISKNGYNVINQVNQGLGATRNTAIRAAKGKYILPLDSDNNICAPYLTTAIEILEREQDISVVYGDRQSFGQSSERMITGTYNMQKLMLGNYIDACAVYRKELFDRIGGYDEKMPSMGFEDWDFWLRASFHGYKFHYLNEICFEYRVLSDSMINSVSMKQFDKVFEYVKQKYPGHMGPQYIRERYLAGLKAKKASLIKLVLAVQAPGLLKWFKRSGWIKSEDVL